MNFLTHLTLSFGFNVPNLENNLHKLNEKLSIIRENQLVNLKYIIKEEKEKEEKNDIIKLSLKYKKENTKDNKVEEFEEKYDIKVNNENDINYDDMLNKKDDIKFLDFDNFLDISKINKNQNDMEDLCNIRYTTEEEQQQNKKVNEA